MHAKSLSPGTIYSQENASQKGINKTNVDILRCSSVILLCISVCCIFGCVYEYNVPKIHYLREICSNSTMLLLLSLCLQVTKKSTYGSRPVETVHIRPESGSQSFGAMSAFTNSVLKKLETQFPFFNHSFLPFSSNLFCNLYKTPIKARNRSCVFPKLLFEQTLIYAHVRAQIRNLHSPGTGIWFSISSLTFFLLFCWRYIG